MEKYIETPKITSPVNGAIRFVGPFQASEYVRVGRFKLTHEYSEWQLSNDAKFINVFQTGQSEKVLKAWVPDLSIYRTQLCSRSMVLDLFGLIGQNLLFLLQNNKRTLNLLFHFNTTYRDDLRM